MLRALPPQPPHPVFNVHPLDLELQPLADPAPQPPAAYPLRIADNRRYLVDAAGIPFLLQGDAAWSLVVNLTLDQAIQYLDDRAAKGFNSVLVNLIERLYADKAPANLDGVLPFHDLDNLATPNDAYFDHAEKVIAAAAERGFLVVLAPIYLGYRTKNPDHQAGWYRAALKSGVDNSYAYGTYLAKRFGQLSNIMWIMGGDFHPDDALPMVDAVARGLKDGGAKGLFTGHQHPEHSPIESFPGASWLDVNNTYTYFLPPEWMIKDYNRDPVWPFFFIEATYENEHNASRLQIRRQAYWSLLCGAFGHIMGNFPMWLFGKAWEDQLSSPGSVAVARWGSYFRKLPWADLVPDLKQRFIVGGMGEIRGLDRVTGAMTPDSKLGVAYLPVQRAVAVDLDVIDADYAEVLWFDPVTGTDLTGGIVRASGVVTLTPPFTEDCVLRVTATSQPR
jgi:hypothetical protein